MPQVQLLAVPRLRGCQIALSEGLVTGLVEKRPALSKDAGAVRRFQADRLAEGREKRGALTLTAFTGIPTHDQIGAIIGSFEGMAANPVQLATNENLSSAIEG